MNYVVLLTSGDDLPEPIGPFETAKEAYNFIDDRQLQDAEPVVVALRSPYEFI